VNDRPRGVAWLSDRAGWLQSRREEVQGWLVALRRADWRRVDRRLLALVLLTGFGQVAYPAGWLIAGTFQHGYSVRDNYVSDLGAQTAIDPWIMNTAFILFAASFVTSAVALARCLPRSPARTVAAVWFGAVGVLFAPLAFLHEDCWSATDQRCWTQQQAGTLSWHHYAHLNSSTAFALFLCLSPLMLWFALPSGALRTACGACAILGVCALVAGVVLVHPDSPASSHSRGLIERIEAGVMLLADPARTEALTGELLPWLLARREDVELMTFAGDGARVAAFERHGLRHLRSSFTLARSDAAAPLAAAAFPDGVTVAPYQLGEADEAVHRLIYLDAAWASVAGHAERDLDGWRRAARSCRSLFLARRDGRPVGWVAGRLLESGRGWVSSLAVAADERGRGLGRALLLHAFADLQRVGARGLALAVEAHNDTALGLYRSVGLEVEREWRIYATVA
jgi:ribosomal protein S18 acetylase RimI-like enzyme